MKRSSSARISLCVAVLFMAATIAATADEAPDFAAQPSFRRHVVPMLSRLGCSARECHGSFAGQGGFQLSLFGYDFEADHKELTADAEGNEGEVRVNAGEPGKSLLVMKPTLQMKHKGKERIRKGSWEH